MPQSLRNEVFATVVLCATFVVCGSGSSQKEAIGRISAACTSEAPVEIERKTSLTLCRPCAPRHGGRSVAPTEKSVVKAVVDASLGPAIGEVAGPLCTVRVSAVTETI